MARYFPQVKMFDGEKFKLATLTAGCSKVTAKNTAKINKKEGNKYRIISGELEGRGKKWACYIKKAKNVGGLLSSDISLTGGSDLP